MGKKYWLPLFILILLITIIVGGCGTQQTSSSTKESNQSSAQTSTQSSSTSSNSSIEGKYFKENSTKEYIEFKSDGTFLHKAASDSSIYTGKYNIKGNEVILTIQGWTPWTLRIDGNNLIDGNDIFLKNSPYRTANPSEVTTKKPGVVYLVWKDENKEPILSDNGITLHVGEKLTVEADSNNCDKGRYFKFQTTYYADPALQYINPLEPVGKSDDGKYVLAAHGYVFEAKSVVKKTKIEIYPASLDGNTYGYGLVLYVSIIE